MGGPQCRLSILRNINVPCRYSEIFLSILKYPNVTCRFYKVAMSPVKFKIVQCRLSDLRKGSDALSNLRVKGPTVCAWLYRSPIIVI